MQSEREPHSRRYPAEVAEIDGIVKFRVFGVVVNCSGALTSRRAHDEFYARRQRP